MARNFARQTVSWLSCLMGVGLLVPVAQAADPYEIRTDTDYIAIVFEAEDHTSKDDRWVLTEPSTPAQEIDPDPNHSDQAVGQAYLELLPDVRVTHADEFGPPTAVWFQPGTGPRAEYPIDFPEAGRYYVHVRAYSTGTEDNGLHIGLDGEFGNSGKNMQFCTAGQGWSWSSKQRDSGGNGPCGAKKTIWVTVDEPGAHNFMISAREDGFEIDRVMLIKDLSDNTRICSPANADDINCSNGSLENVDDVVDMQVELERYGENLGQLAVGQTVDVTAVVHNLDGYDAALDVVLSLTLGLGNYWDVISMPEECTRQDDDIQCELGRLTPSGPEDETLLDFSLTPLRGGELIVEADINTSSVDDGADNDYASMTISVEQEMTLSNLSVVISEPAQSWQLDGEHPLNFTVSNTGPAVAENVSVNLSMPNGLTVTGMPVDCAVSGAFRCSYEQLDVDESRAVTVQLSASTAGLFSINLAASADNLDVNSEEQSFDSVIVTVEAAEQAPVEPEESTGDGAGEGEATGDSEGSVAKTTGTGFTGSWVLTLLALGLLLRGAAVFSMLQAFCQSAGKYGSHDGDFNCAIMRRRSSATQPQSTRVQ